VGEKQLTSGQLNDDLEARQRRLEILKATARRVLDSVPKILASTTVGLSDNECAPESFRLVSRTIASTVESMDMLTEILEACGEKDLVTQLRAGIASLTAMGSKLEARYFERGGVGA
jgi:hypothetical protein